MSALELSGTRRCHSWSSRWLAPQVGGLLRQHPKLQVDLIPDSRDFGLTLREADIALRLARPATGGNSVLARRVGCLPFSAFAAKAHAGQQNTELPWITYDDSMAHLPQAKWLAKAARQGGEQAAGLRVHDLETALEAVLAGVGKSLLPNPVADRIPTLQKLEACFDMFSREVWLLAHRNRQSVRRVEVVGEWIANLFQDAG